MTPFLEIITVHSASLVSMRSKQGLSLWLLQSGWTYSTVYDDYNCEPSAKCICVLGGCDSARGVTDTLSVVVGSIHSWHLRCWLFGTPLGGDEMRLCGLTLANSTPLPPFPPNLLSTPINQTVRCPGSTRGVAMFGPAYLDIRTFFYPIGNTPAVCLCRNLPSDCHSDVLLLGCGDVRNVLFTLHSEQNTCK
jgi:hypothetical protein